MKLLILDGNSVINRAFFGVRPLTTREGLYTHAIYGFLNILEKVEKEEQPEAIAVAFDLHGPTFRHLKYEGYKANRHGMPEELAMQMPVMKDVLRAMNIPIYECAGWEVKDRGSRRRCGSEDRSRRGYYLYCTPAAYPCNHSGTYGRAGSGKVCNSVR